jgi:enolase
MPVGNCIGGGLHSKIEKGEKRPDFQEFLLIPKEDIFKKAFNKNLNAYEHAKKLIKKAEKKWTIDINDENAIKTSLTNEETLEILKQTADKFDLRIGIDLASSSFYRQGYYEYKNKEIMRNALEQEENILFLIEKFDLFYVEDPLQEEDFSGFSSLMKEMKKKKLSAMIVGDDLTVTNFERTKKAVEKNCINAMIIKPNQNGYLMEVARIIEYCKEKKIKIIFSHRSGETMDDALGDYAMGFEADFVKTGILGKERLIKLKRIIDIEGS